METLFIGSLYPKEREQEINENTLVNYQYAANNLQWALVEGLSNYFSNLNIVTAPVVGSYPKGYKRIYLSGSNFKNEFLSNSKNHSISFLNLPLINLVNKYFSVKKKVRKWIKANNNSEKHIIIYSPHTPFLKAAVDAKKYYKDLEITLIVPDLPEYMSDNKSLLYKLLKNIDKQFIDKYITQVDSFVLLSKHMKERLNVGDRKWVLIEGVFQSVDSELYYTDNPDKKIVLYTGALTEKDGIYNLIEAFKKIPDTNYCLWLRGNGPIRSKVSEIIKDDKRIKLIDRLSRKELIEMQQKATVLINPTSANDPSAKYFFPSKMMDYLASGTPTITTELPGIPEEYFKFCIVLRNESVDALKNKIIEVCELNAEERNIIGSKAREFILNNKNPIKQAGKIHNMLTSKGDVYE